MIYDIHKPREERDFREIYPDLNEEDQLKVFIVKQDEDESAPVVNGNSTVNDNINCKAPSFKMIESEVCNLKMKFPKQVVDFGFQDPSKKNNLGSKTYIRPFQTNSELESIERLLERKKSQVEYDMDEQDLLYLNHRNSQIENTIKITSEIFEILITILENEWNLLNHKISLNGVIESNKFFTLDKNHDKYGNDDGIVPGSIYDQRCAVCNDSDCENSNAIVFCDGCDIAVHQECYGVAFIPEGQWLCRKCMINKNRTTDCVFCPSKTGAFKQLDNSLWSHVICGLWINELYFANPTYMEPIEGIDSIPKSRWKLNCYICKQKVGACIQCYNRNCFQAYHVTCAKRAGLYMELEQGIQGAINNKTTLKSFCDKHGPANWDEKLVLQGINKTRLYFRDLKILNNQNQKLINSYKTANKLNVFKWKTENGTPIAPKLFADKLYEILLSLKIENNTKTENGPNQIRRLNILPNRTKQDIQNEIMNIANEICRYWCLKRESKRGAPLIPQNNNLNNLVILYNNNEEMTEDEYCQQIQEKIEFLEILIQDIKKLIDLSLMTLFRQKIDSDLQTKNLEVMNLIYFPINQLIDDLLNKLNSKYDSNKLIFNYTKLEPNLQTIFVKNKSYLYKTIEHFKQDVEEFYRQSMVNLKFAVNLRKQLKKWMLNFKKMVPQLFEAESRLGQSRQLRGVPFVETEGYNLTFKTYNYQQILQDNDLSDVELMDAQQESKLGQFLKRGLH